MAIELNHVFQKLRESKSNYMEYYEKQGKVCKPFKDVYLDVLSAITVLEDWGLKKGDRVAIIGKTSYDWIVIDLACLAKGLFTVPLDINKHYNPDELKDEFKLSLIITNLKEYSPDGKTIIGFDDICRNGEPNDHFMPEVYEDDDIFTTTFTSGTTGKQKAIEVRAKCFNDQFTNASRLFHITEADKVLIFLPMNIYLERCYVYLAIITGFNVVVCSPEYVLKAMKNSGITFTVGVPYFFESLYELFMMEVKSNRWLWIRFRMYRLLNEAGLGFWLKKPFPPFQKFWGGRARFFLTGSAACKKKVLQAYSMMGIPLYEGYGMSEIANMLALNYPGKTKLGSVGTIFPNKEIKFDEMGQILVRGEHVANNKYYNESPEVNASSYLHDGWVATGDIGHLDKDGFLYIDGRIKDVIALSNGKKIHPSYIEEKINQSDLISNCIVFGDDKPYMVALIGLKDKTTGRQPIEQFIQQVNRSLPADEQVKNFQIITEPFTPQNGMLTPSFKLDRKFIKKNFEKDIESLYLM